MIVTTRMHRVLEVDAAARVAWVEPGVLNLDLTRAVAHLDLHYAPDPSSQQACTIGGNVGTNAGGPHCLSAGVTSAHVLAVEVVLADGTVSLLGDLTPDTPGLDLRGAFVGSEGTMGIATRIAVRLVPDAPEVRTLLADFAAIDDAAAAVSAVIAAGIVPAALEMMDARITRAVEDFVGAGFPRDAEAVLLVEVTGLAAGVAVETAAIDRICREHGACDGARRGGSRRARPAVEGEEIGIRCGRAHRTRLLPPRRGGAAHEARRGDPARLTRSRTGTGSSR